jgi:hypothetical protein
MPALTTGKRTLPVCLGCLPSRSWAEIILVIEHHLVSKSEHDALKNDASQNTRGTSFSLTEDDTFDPAKSRICRLYT